VKNLFALRGSVGSGYGQLGPVPGSGAKPVACAKMLGWSMTGAASD
jgi:hypothetical protein